MKLFPQFLAKGMRQVAVNMKRLGMDMESIINCTGLTEEEIASL